MATIRQRDIHVIDAAEQPLGRTATQVARFLMGKHKATYAPNVDAGDFVHVKNAARIGLTGRKRGQKTYKWYTGYQGGLRERKLSAVMATDPTDAVRRAVKNMLPKNTFQTARMRRLRITR